MNVLRWQLNYVAMWLARVVAASGSSLRYDQLRYFRLIEASPDWFFHH